MSSYRVDYAKRLTNWFCMVAKCPAREEATSGPQTVSLSLMLSLMLFLSPLPPPSSSPSCTHFNDCLNCSFFFFFSLSLLQAKPIYGGWLCLAPEGTDFDNPMQRSRVRLCMQANVCAMYVVGGWVLFVLMVVFSVPGNILSWLAPFLTAISEMAKRIGELPLKRSRSGGAKWTNN